MGLKITTCGLRECIDAAADRLDWSAPRSGAKNGRRGRKRGVGMASLIHVGGSGRIYRSDGSGLIVKLDDFGNVNVYYGGVEMGQGLHSALTLMIADGLGVRPERVVINPTDTGTCPWDVGTHASRGAFMAGNAALMAAGKIRAEIFEECVGVFPDEVRKNLRRHLGEKADHDQSALAFLEGITAEDFELADGVLSVRGGPDEPWARVELARFLRAIHFRKEAKMIAADVFFEPKTDLPDWEKGYGNMSMTYTFGAQSVEVDVDEETGEVEVIRMVNAIDVGRVLNRQTLEGQMYGGIAQGIGYALYEEVKTDKGRITNPGFTDYKIPTVHEMAFPIDLVFVETDDPAGPFGAKGVGEPALVPTAPAIANAVYDAVGVRIRDLPITPEKVLAALARLSP